MGEHAMEYRQLGTTDLKVSAVCLGTMTFGRQNTEAEGHAQLDYALAQGINFFDTAEMYPVASQAETYGRTEEIVGSWLARQQRDQVIIATKAAGPSRGLNWIRNGQLRFDRAGLHAAIDASLKRLRTDYVDLYQLHWPERNQPMFGQSQYEPGKERDSTPIREQLEALAELVQAGKVRHVGVSNEHPWGIMQFLQAAKEFGLPHIASTQNAYSLLNRSYDYSLAELCHREQVGLLAYSPLAFGHLSGKYLADPSVPGRINFLPGFGQRYDKPGVPPAVASYLEIARKHGLTLTQLSLSWMYRRWCVASTIIGATTLPQLEENIGAWQVPLNDAALADIEAAFVRHGVPAP